MRNLKDRLLEYSRMLQIEQKDSDMALANKPLNEINEADLQELIANQVAEGKEYDYKLQVGNSDADKKEFLADASSFANTVGGHLIVGMDEDQGIPTAIVGISGDIDATKQRFENMLRDSIAPRIQGVGVQAVPVAEGNVLVIRIPQSWSAPHMVTFGGSSRFYGRNSAGKYPLDVYELRSAFTLSESARERIRDFRLDRIAKIAADEVPIRLGAGARFILHVIPLGAFASGTPVDLSLSVDHIHEWMGRISTKTVFTHFRHNLDGLLFHGTGQRERYIQVFRNGAMEFVDMWLLNDSDRFIPGVLYEQIILDVLPIFFSLQMQFGIQPPIIVMLTLLGVRDYTMGVPGYRIARHYNASMIDRNDLLIPDALIENFNDDLTQKLKPLFDTVWNSSGYPHSLNYDDAGNWRPMR